ncbi:MAG: hypothetical protein AAFY88_18255, partial [Acidobacteriota bacterium]
IESVHKSIAVTAPTPKTTSWGSAIFEIRDPDGIPVTFLQWLPQPDGSPTETSESALPDQEVEP